MTHGTLIAWAARSLAGDQPGREAISAPGPSAEQEAEARKELGRDESLLLLQPCSTYGHGLTRSLRKNSPPWLDDSHTAKAMSSDTTQTPAEVSTLGFPLKWPAPFP